VTGLAACAIGIWPNSGTATIAKKNITPWGTPQRLIRAFIAFAIVLPFYLRKDIKVSS
jgi:hypothetical protein